MYKNHENDEKYKIFKVPPEKGVSAVEDPIFVI